MLWLICFFFPFVFTFFACVNVVQAGAVEVVHAGGPVGEGAGAALDFGGAGEFGFAVGFGGVEFGEGFAAGAECGEVGGRRGPAF